MNRSFVVTYLGHSILKEQYMIKLFNLDLLSDEGALVSDRSNV